MKDNGVAVKRKRIISPVESPADSVGDESNIQQNTITSIDIMKETMDRYETCFIDMKDAMNRYENEFGQKEKEIQSSKKEKRILKAQLRDCKKQENDLRSELEKKKEELENLRNVSESKDRAIIEKDEALSENKKLKADLEALQKNFDDSEDRCKIKEVDLEDAEKNLNVFKNKCIELEKEKEVYKKFFDGVSSDVHKCEQRIHQVQRQPPLPQKQRLPQIEPQPYVNQFSGALQMPPNVQEQGSQIRTTGSNLQMNPQQHIRALSQQTSLSTNQRF